ncbi:MAG: Gfo/Idh/MocA family oxidoreductase [Kiritimatiellae bacterium]|nr:Gfo/Idh/MocA family oxidoreductase [Kiritimatiellia bacterium]
MKKAIEQVTGFGTSSRRTFLKRSVGAGSALALPYFIPASALGKDGAVAPSERIVMGVIGVGGRGITDTRWMLSQKDLHFVAICDVQKRWRDQAKSEVDARYGNTDCAAYRDFRQLLERKEIDAVVIATGDRWHALASILSMQAGKDVYCEKPGCRTIDEGQALVKCYKSTGRIFQTGAQRVSEKNFVFAGELLRQGRLGKVETVRAHLGFLPAWPRVNAVLPAVPQPPVDELDWDMWLGPAPWRDYNPEFLKPWPVPGWYTQYDFAAGIAQWGSHTILQCQMDLGLADTSAVEYEYPTAGLKEGMTIHFANKVKLIAQIDGWRGSCGVRYEGSEGWVAAADGYERPDLSDPALFSDYRKLVDGYAERTGRPFNHIRDFVDCVKSRRPAVTDAVVAHRTMTTNLIMDICLDLKRSLKWDPVKEEFIGDDEANALRTRVMREPFRI